MKTRSLPNTSNAATFSDVIGFTDDDTGDPLDISTVDEITVRVRDPRCRVTMLEATLTAETVVETADGEVRFTFTPDQMGALEPGNYEFGVTITIDGVTTQTHICPLPIVDGL